MFAWARAAPVRALGLWAGAQMSLQGRWVLEASRPGFQACLAPHMELCDPSKSETWIFSVK